MLLCNRHYRMHVPALQARSMSQHPASKRGVTAPCSTALRWKEASRGNMAQRAMTSWVRAALTKPNSKGPGVDTWHACWDLGSQSFGLQSAFQQDPARLLQQLLLRLQLDQIGIPEPHSQLPQSCKDSMRASCTAPLLYNLGTY